MASEEKFLELRGDSDGIMAYLWESLLEHCFLETKHSNSSYYEPVPGMELKIGRLLRFDPFSTDYDTFFGSRDINPFELTAAIFFNGCTFHDRDTLNKSVSPGAFFMDNIRSSKLSPRGWHHLIIGAHLKDNVLAPLDPDNDDYANVFPLLLCFTILKTFTEFPASLMQGFDSPLVVGFEDALPYFLDKIYDNVLHMFSKFIEHPSSVDEPSPLKSLRVLVVAIKFLLHRLSLPDYEKSHTTILHSLTVTTEWILEHTFSSQEGTVVMPALENIIALRVIPPLNIGSDDPDWCPRKLWQYTIPAYQTLTSIAPSTCSLCGLRSMVDLMTSHWDQTAMNASYPSVEACKMLTHLLAKRIPLAFTVVPEKQCLEFLRDHVFLPTSVPFVSAYIAGVFTMQRGSDVDAATLQLHIDYLNNPSNLFTACSILATHGIRNTDRSAIHRDIMTLVQLRPRRDAAWDECREKLHDLVQSDGGDFFSKQLTSLGFEKGRPLRADEIQIEKDNIRYAIHVLDDFFDGRAH
ncbi:hypothetical protein EDD85DRAFT_856120, partial [Armillaria nabsnona]